jgi:hypothetical protein
MPATAANVNTEKRATSAASARPAQPIPSPSVGETTKVRTWNATDTQAQAKQPSKYRDARKFLNTHHLLADNAPCMAQTLAGILHTLAETYKMPNSIAKALGHVAETLEHIEQQQKQEENAKSLPELMKELQSNLSTEMDSKIVALEKKLTPLPAAQEHLEDVAKKIGHAVESIKASIDDMGFTIAQVTDTSSQLANTATSYKDALTRSGKKHPRTHSPASQSQTDPRIARDVDRKARQILINTLDPKITGASLAKIKEKVSTAIKAITNPPPPKDTSIMEISKLHKGGFTVLFKEREVINWLQSIGVELKFVTGIAQDATITKCVYSILIPCIPLSFNPSDNDHLREVEECNNLPAGTIEKARWIKPAYRQASEQRAAHAIFAIKDISLANICIRDGITVCSL